MVKAASTFGRSGSHDFILLRASAIILALYSIFMVSFLVSADVITYVTWTNLFAHLGMKIFTMLALTAILIHGWIGIFQVLTDYVKKTGLRAFLQYAVCVALIVYWLAGLLVVWPVEGV
ncbi:succinate dehydrogenase, hydrophobic membrane anchor protein [Pseudidiomarina gelatinasegens]|uniref:Succinate dehydrogenase hydrophobic membrane anchor subunit n=1 Tax=Pseudidiomarina gelatinasegens TaxID=2487740 RepID=A0A451GER0_9GAMM|nr:succinate dehydrogenase, hydrophobic membrane anchor protein [Pseudidiomarina gelatinasegens]RWU11583.1 succinate dehydrogenase, hydrophobic membrane anchor protein [Pseudidiomarina gelatinasegens]